MFIECKASNSGVNSRKRLHKEVTKNVGQWLKGSGAEAIGSCAMRGVFNPDTVEIAQKNNVFIFWHHRLNDLDSFLKDVAKTASPPI